MLTHPIRHFAVFMRQITLCVVFGLCASVASAQQQSTSDALNLDLEPTSYTTPLMVSVYTPLQLPLKPGVPITNAVNGLRINLLYGNVDFLKGLDVGVCNIVNRSATALQIGVINQSDSFRGWQLGVINASSVFKGFQLGLINYTDAGRGVQIGLININADTDVGFFPIIMMSF